MVVSGVPEARLAPEGDSRRRSGGAGIGAGGVRGEGEARVTAVGVQQPQHVDRTKRASAAKYLAPAPRGSGATEGAPPVPPEPPALEAEESPPPAAAASRAARCRWRMGGAGWRWGRWGRQRRRGVPAVAARRLSEGVPAMHAARAHEEPARSTATPHPHPHAHPQPHPHPTAEGEPRCSSSNLSPSMRRS